MEESPCRGRMSKTLEQRLQHDLKSLIEYVATHEELDLQLRDNYCNIYFNGGNILRVTFVAL